LSVGKFLLLETIFEVIKLGAGLPDKCFKHATYIAPGLYVRAGGNYKGHVDVLAPTVQELAALEKEAQTSFLHLGYLPNQLFRTF
jgi:hypothetical protein